MNHHEENERDSRNETQGKRSVVRISDPKDKNRPLPKPILKKPKLNPPKYPRKQDGESKKSGLTSLKE
jgi:hypothetical protein